MAAWLCSACARKRGTSAPSTLTSATPVSSQEDSMPSTFMEGSLPIDRREPRRRTVATRQASAHQDEVARRLRGHVGHQRPVSVYLLSGAFLPAVQASSPQAKRPLFWTQWFSRAWLIVYLGISIVT